MRMLSGKEAIAIMVEEIADQIGGRRLRVFEMKVRSRLPKGGTAKEWIATMGDIIVEEDDAKANAGFMKGIRRIHELSAKR